jgi:hypothetical protein
MLSPIWMRIKTTQPRMEFTNIFFIKNCKVFYVVLWYTLNLECLHICTFFFFFIKISWSLIISSLLNKEYLHYINEGSKLQWKTFNELTIIIIKYFANNDPRLYIYWQFMMLNLNLGKSRNLWIQNILNM